MDEMTLENFILYCDDMELAEEGLFSRHHEKKMNELAIVYRKMRLDVKDYLKLLEDKKASKSDPALQASHIQRCKKYRAALVSGKEKMDPVDPSYKKDVKVADACIKRIDREIASFEKSSKSQNRKGGHVGMDSATLESFIEFCDEMQIAEEGLKEFGQRIIIHLRHLIRSIVNLFRKVRKIRMPEDVYNAIMELMQKIESYPPSLDADTVIFEVKDTDAYDLLFVRSRAMTYTKEDLREFDTRETLKMLTTVDKKLKMAELAVTRGDVNATRQVPIFNLEYEILNQLFVWSRKGIGQDNTIKMKKEFTVTIDDNDITEY